MTERASTILICEDEAIVRIWLRRELIRYGYDVVGEAKDGDAAIDLAERLHPDLVLMDIKMPRRDGISASAEIMRRSPTPIVILTAYGQDEMVARALDAGVSGYLVKPVESSQIVPALTVARARFSELMKLHEQVDTLEEALAQRKLLDRAKGILIRQLGLDEPGAHQLLQRLSSQQRVPVKDVAARVIQRSTQAGGIRPEDLDSAGKPC